MDEVKQWIVIRRDLKMRRGKEIAQGSHSSMAFMVTRLLDKELGGHISVADDFSEEELAWMQGLFTKITLQVDSEEELKNIHDAAVAAGLTCYMIIDSGKTEFNGVPTPTALAIGPHRTSKVTSVVGHLKLY